MALRSWLLAALAAAGLLAGKALAQDSKYGVVTKGTDFVYTRLGSPSDVSPPTRFGILMEGGGRDVNEAYEWLCDHAGNGDILILRATGTADYNPYIRKLCPNANSVATLKITGRKGAHQQFVVDAVDHAEALFIAGGSQNDYIVYYQTTPLNKAIQALIRRRAPIGGTSAGNAVLAQFAFGALTNLTITSAQALANPYDPRITITNGFLRTSPLLADTITDDHFITRDRMGRLVAFLARMEHGGGAPRAFGIAEDENTAFLMEADGKGKVVGSSNVYFLGAARKPEVCKLDTPLTYETVPVYRISRGRHLRRRGMVRRRRRGLYGVGGRRRPQFQPAGRLDLLTPRACYRR